MQFNSSPKRTVAVLVKSGIEQEVSHRTLIIPGYVAPLSGKIEQETGWKVLVGPRDAAALLNSWRRSGTTDMPSVTFLPGFRKVDVGKGRTILEAAQRGGILMNVVCGGQGKCGKCIVFVKSGRYEFDEEKFARFFSPEDLGAGACLACQTSVIDDIRVFIPEESIVQDQKILIDVKGTPTELDPAVWKYYLNLSPRACGKRWPCSKGAAWGPDGLDDGA